MLAEPKRKTVWSLNPRGKYWSEDKSKLGQKLLESMGWKEGHGLGKYNNGIKDNIKVNVNSDNKGLGYKPSADSVWVDKNDDYEQLLADLALHHNIASNKQESKVSNLEENSKKLRNRLHYSKFIKAKNLSQCSEKDLISIFPKKRQNINEKIAEQSAETKSSENTFESTTNIREYFRSKIHKLKLKFNQIDSTKVDEKDMTNEDNTVSVEDNTVSVEDNTVSVEDNTVSVEDNTESVEDNTESVEDKSSERKKRKSQESSEGSDNSMFDLNIDCNHKKQKKSTKKSKLNKEKCVQNSYFVDNSSNIDFEFQTKEKNITKKEKRNKKRKPNIDLDSEEIDSQTSSDCQKKSNQKLKLKVEKYVTTVPKGYNANNMSVTESLKNYPKMCSAIEKDKALSSTNLIALKGYGCHSH